MIFLKVASLSVCAALPAAAFIRDGAILGRVAKSRGLMMSAASAAVDAATLKSCMSDLKKLVDEKNCGPILIRLAWHDSGTYDKRVTGPWPAAGGAIGTIRFKPEITHGANAGLTNALALLQPYKEKYPSISWSDIMQMASAAAIEMAGGPKIPMRYGRVDAAGPEYCSPEGNLPAGGKPFPDSDTAQGHLRNVFYRMGLGDMEIVALSGAHTMGRAYKDRSGFGAEKTKFTSGDVKPRKDGKAGYGSAGGSSWTEKWLSFDNSYFQTVADDDADPELLKLETDTSIFADPGFKPFALKYKNSQEAFFADYAIAHKKLSELGAKFEPAEGIVLTE